MGHNQHFSGATPHFRHLCGTARLHLPQRRAPQPPNIAANQPPAQPQSAARRSRPARKFISLRRTQHVQNLCVRDSTLASPFHRTRRSRPASVQHAQGKLALVPCVLLPLSLRPLHLLPPPSLACQPHPRQKPNCTSTYAWRMHPTATAKLEPAEKHPNASPALAPFARSSPNRP